MKKALITTIVVLLIAATAVYAFRDEVFLTLAAAMMGPETGFADTRPPDPPDYRQPSAWAARPDIADPSDERPPGLSPPDSRDRAAVAVFFVHPTSFMARTAWNQPLDDATANRIVDERILRHQASVFNDCCEVWAPRYRQATFFSFIDTSGDGERALALAYDDVKAAFAVFLTELGPDQPFILAGHSQGTRHATALLRDTIAGTGLYDRMVAAYLVGFSISHDDLGSVPACENDVQIRCAVGWNAMDGEGAGVFGDTENLLCTNPLTWELGEAYAAHDLNLGAIGFPSWRPEPDEDPTLARPVPGVADAQCYKGQLAVRELRSDAFPSRMGGNSLHPYDYSLFHMNIRENARRRVQAYLTVMASGTAG